MKKKLVNTIDSKLYAEDKDYETEEDKDGFYLYGEFWNDGADILKTTDGEYDEDNTVYLQCVDNEIFAYPYDEITDELKLMIERFYNDDWEQHFTPLLVGNDIDYKDDKNYNPNLSKLWYRGGEGYHYYCHQYNYPLQNTTVIWQ